MQIYSLYVRLLIYLCRRQLKISTKVIKKFKIMLTYLERMDVKRQLPSGSTNQIARMAGVTPSYVSQWWACKANSKKVEDCVFMLLINSRKESEKKLREAGML